MDPLVITTLRARRFYGRPADGLAADLSPGLTVIYGANGAGKTTLARALGGVVWPETVAPHAPSYEAAFRVGETPWTVRIDEGAARYTADGEPSDAPPLPDAGVAPRYHLSLHDLGTVDGAELADAIRRQAVGGVDLDAVAQAVGARAAVPPRLDAAGDARQASDALHALQDDLARLRDDEARLADLDGAVEDAAAADAATDLYTRLLDRAAQRDALAAAERDLDAFPAAHHHVAPDTAERYAALAAAVVDASRAVADAEASSRAAAAAVAAHGWSTLAPPSPETMAARLRRTVEAARERDEARRALDAARSRVAEARAPLGRAASVAVAPEAVAEVARHVREAARRFARLDAARDAVRGLRAREQDIRFHDPDALTAGLRLLRQWLAYAVEDERTGPRLPVGAVWAAAAVVAVASVIAALVVEPWALVGLLGAVALAAVALRLKPVAGGIGPAERARLAYGGLAADAVTAPQPQAWTPAAVEALVAQMDLELARQTERRMWKERAEQVARAAAEAEAAAAEARAEGQALAERLGVGYPDVPEAFFAHVEALARAGEAQRDAAAAEGALEAAETALADALDAFRAETTSLPVPAAADAAAAEGVVATLRAETAARDRLADAARRAEEAAAEARSASVAAVGALAAFLAPLDADPESADEAVAALVAAHPRWADAVARVREAATLAAEADARVRAHPAYDTATHDALERPALVRLHDEARLRASRRDAHVQEAARIRERVEQARRSRALADAGARHEAALDRLSDAYAGVADARVAHVLAGAIAAETRDDHLPRVFGRARDLFATLTADRYRLRLAEAGSVSPFEAEDAVSGHALALDELSAATRLHLLLAVRLAFVETQEAGLRLPLVVDEALATSDAARADGVADALWALARDGRQVVCLTASAADVARWQRRADADPDVPFAIVTLPATSTLPLADGLPDVATTQAVPVPEPGETVDAYAARLGMPAWNAWEPAAALPVAALAGDAADLHALLAAGYERWGPLAAARRRGARLPVAPEALTRMASRTQAAEAWASAWREGRGRPVDREALAATAAVPDGALDAVADLARTHDGRAADLLAALADGAVPAVSSDDLTALAQALAEAGHVTTAEPLDAVALRQRVAEASPSDVSGALATLDRLRLVATAAPIRSAGVNG